MVRPNEYYPIRHVSDYHFDLLKGVPDPKILKKILWNFVEHEVNAIKVILSYISNLIDCVIPFDGLVGDFIEINKKV